MNAFNHIAFHCRDIFAQEKFYTKHFGFKRSRTFHPSQPNEFFMLKLGTVRLEFFTSGKTGPGDRGGEQPIGCKHLAFDVPKIEPILEALRADGIEPDPIIDCSKVADGMCIVFFRDPEGNIIELMENYRDETDA